VTSRAALARLPVLRKSELPALHKAAPPFGGFVPGPWVVRTAVHLAGPIFEPEPSRRPLARRAGAVRGRLPARRRGAQHLQLPSDARRLHLRRLGAGAGLRGDSGRPGNTEQQFELIEAYRPVGYSGTPDFLKILLDAAASAAATSPRSSARWFPARPSRNRLQDEVKSRGIDAYQAFGTADLGMVAVRDAGARRHGRQRGPDHGNRASRHRRSRSPGDVGEIVVTSLDPQHPWIRLALGDLTAALPGASPCGRTNMRIKGWMGRADQTTKVKGMFVRPSRSPRSASAIRSSDACASSSRAPARAI
jgi:phenylacetate-CoA ligase